VEVLNKQIETFEKRDAAAFAALYAPDALLSDPAYPEPLRGRMEIEQDLRDFFTALPDVGIQVTRVLQDGPVFAAEYTMSGTHNGPIKLPTGTVPATGRRVEFHAANFTRLDGEGRIVEERRYYDVAGQLTQLGLS
jgi:steroid delta-isomerase-like uncharacterized protein